MICDTCIHKEVCYENEEDREALKFCADYFNFVEELEKIKEEIKDLLFSYGYLDIHTNNDVLEIIENRISELKGEDK